MYTSESLALAALEYLVHVDPKEAPDDLVATSAEIPDEVGIEHLEAGDLPGNWRQYPAPPALADLGTAWVARRSTAVLSVPSALIPDERNYLLNPVNRDFTAIRVATPQRFSFEPRLLARRTGRRRGPANRT